MRVVKEFSNGLELWDQVANGGIQFADIGVSDQEICSFGVFHRVLHHSKFHHKKIARFDKVTFEISSTRVLKLIQIGDSPQLNMIHHTG